MSLSGKTRRTQTGYRGICSPTIIKYSNDDKQRIKIAKKGKLKYLKHFNSTVVADYIINKTLDNKYKKNKYLWDTE